MQEQDNFRPRTLASFTRQQFNQVLDWALANGVNSESAGNAFGRALESAKLDEKGKPMSDKGRNRIRYAFGALLALRDVGIGPADIKGEVRVLSKPNPDDIEVNYESPAFGYRTFV